MTKEIIKIEELKREFTMGTETVHALRGISFTIHEGEFVTVMGSSGSGKSTLLNILGCLELPLLYNSKVSTDERRKRAIEALEKVGLGDRLHHTPAQLSGGQQQRVTIARSLVNNPVMILADEATGNLDTRTSYEIMSLFQELNAQGITITFVTHEPDIAAFSARTIVLRDGLILQDYKNNKVQSAVEQLAKLPQEEHSL